MKKKRLMKENRNRPSLIELFYCKISKRVHRYVDVYG